MKSNEQHRLVGHAGIDEITITGPDEQSPGRSKGDKKLVCLAVKIRAGEKMRRADGTIINDYSRAELRKIFDTHIFKERAIVDTDE